MLDHAREAVELTRSKSRTDLDTHRMLNLSLVRLIEIIGEAAARVSADVKQNHPGIPWSQIVSMRNRLIHGYDSVDFDILWQIVHHDLPTLISQLERLVSEANR
jgi:uncharacterized protein with HEPN domain